LAIGLAIPILLLYAIKRILRRFLTGYAELALQHRLSYAFYSIQKSSFLRFTIIIATIALLVTTILSMVSLIYTFTHGTSSVYIFNMLVLIIAQIWLLSWLCGMLKHSRQISPKPRFAVVFWSLLAVAVFCAFVGISPFSDIKSSAATFIANLFPPPATETATETSTTPPTLDLPTPPSPTSTTYEINKGKYPTWVWANDYTYISKGNNQPVELYENPNAQNPTWEQLRDFLLKDNTDKIPYVPSYFVCADFAETLHSNAEKAGIRCGFVILYGVDHACNAFETTDRGLVFIDCTGKNKYEAGPDNLDKVVAVQLGIDYIPKFLFSNNANWTIKDIGKITRYQICWKAGTILDYQYDYAIASIPYVPPYTSTLPPSFVVIPPAYIPPSSSYVPPSIPSTTPPSSTPICRECCEDRCSKYQGVWRNGCIEDCMNGKANWTWK
jgi:hypothetical protein